MRQLSQPTRKKEATKKSGLTRLNTKTAFTIGTLTVTGGIFASLNSYLGTLTLCEKYNINSTTLPWCAFATNILSFYCFNLPKSIAKAATINLDKTHLPQPKDISSCGKMVFKVIFTALGISAYSFLAFFGTRHSLIKQTAMTTNTNSRLALSATSACCAFATISFTRAPAFWELSSNRKRLQFQKQDCKLKALIGILFSTGALDIIITGINYYTSTIDTINEVSPSHEDSFIPLAISFAITGAILHFAFAIYGTATEWTTQANEKSVPLLNDFEQYIHTHGPTIDETQKRKMQYA